MQGFKSATVEITRLPKRILADSLDWINLYESYSYYLFHTHRYYIIRNTNLN